MILRAAIFLLIVLNLGAALWWMTGGGSADTPLQAATPAGVMRLELAPAAPAQDADAQAQSTSAAGPEESGSADTGAADAPAAIAAPVTAAAAEPTAAREPATPVRQCFSFGPFADVP